MLKTKLFLFLLLTHLQYIAIYTENVTEQKKLSAIAVPPAKSPLSYMVSNGNNNNNNNVAPNPTIKHEAYKALAGETVRLECPQPNPTWFFRRLNRDNSNPNNLEDLIVTRHGIINADYKYKIMCHVTLKHQVIIINNIDFEEEGLYTCLYTQPVNAEAGFHPVKSLTDKNNNSPVQYRYVFNVSVYSKLSTLICYTFKLMILKRT